MMNCELYGKIQTVIDLNELFYEKFLFDENGLSLSLIHQQNVEM